MKNTIAIMLLGILCLLTACEQKKSQEPATMPPIKNTEETVGISATEPKMEQGIGSIGHGPYEYKTDEEGAYIPYEGGEISVPYEIRAQGSSFEKPVGILLFLGGQPQPYHTAEDPVDKYLHYFSVEDSIAYRINLFFTPICGQAGDILDFYGININDPEYNNRESNSGFKHTFGSVVSGLSIRFTETPPKTDPQPIATIESYSIAEESVEVSDLPMDWTDESWDNGLDVQWNLDGDPVHTDFWNYSAESDGHLHGEFMGTSMTDYGVAVFVDNQPVSFDGSHYLPIKLHRGQKQVLDIKLELDNFSGEQVVYAVFVPRTARTSAASTMAMPFVSPTFYLMEGENPNSKVSD